MFGLIGRIILLERGEGERLMGRRDLEKMEERGGGWMGGGCIILARRKKNGSKLLELLIVCAGVC